MFELEFRIILIQIGWVSLISVITKSGILWSKLRESNIYLYKYILNRFNLYCKIKRTIRKSSKIKIRNWMQFKKSC